MSAEISFRGIVSTLMTWQMFGRTTINQLLMNFPPPPINGHGLMQQPVFINRNLRPLADHNNPATGAFGSTLNPGSSHLY